MSPGAAPRTSSLRTNTKNDLLAQWDRMGHYASKDVTHGLVIDRLRAAVLTGATNAQLAALVLGAVDALDVIDSDPRPTTP